MSVHIKFIATTILAMFVGPCFAGPDELDTMICNLEANTAVLAAENKQRGVPLEQSLSSIENRIFDSYEDDYLDLLPKLKGIVREKVVDVYLFAPMELMKKTNFRDLMFSSCISDMLPESSSSLTIDQKFVRRMSYAFEHSLPHSMTEDLKEKLSNTAASCVLNAYKLADHKATNEFITYTANGEPHTSVKSKIMLTYAEDPEATNINKPCKNIDQYL